VGPDTAAAAHAYLRERELVSYAYLEQFHRLKLADGRTAEALCYIVDPNHSQYAAGLSLGVQARVISSAVGSVGPNSEYLLNTASHLAALGIEDNEVQQLCALLQNLPPHEA
jgi:cation transport protein ChaC